MHLSTIKVGLKLFETVEAVEPEIMEVAAAFEKDNGRKPTLREIGTPIEHAIQKVLAGPAGDITI